jgi:hypothetical protein
MNDVISKKVEEARVYASKAYLATLGAASEAQARAVTLSQDAKVRAFEARDQLLARGKALKIEGENLSGSMNERFENIRSEATARFEATRGQAFAKFDEVRDLLNARIEEARKLVEAQIERLRKQAEAEEAPVAEEAKKEEVAA